MLKKSFTGLRTTDKRVLESWINENGDMSIAAKSMLLKFPDKANIADDAWRAAFSEQHKNLIRHP